MLGGKTGYTDLARQTYVGVAERHGRRLVVTLLAAETQPIGSLTEATSLLDWGFRLPSGMSVGRLVEPEQASPSSAAGTAKAEAPAVNVPKGANNRPPAMLAGVAVATFAVLVILIVAASRRRLATSPEGRRWRRRRHHDGDQS
jgi:D-alanyl-D-alanine carboxypeptidase (penicillin-binding protein 5/6)